jgi:membrane-bound ClpP family serine protease
MPLLTVADGSEYELAADAGSPIAVAAVESLAVPEITFMLVAVGLLCLVARVALPALGWSSLAAGATLLLLGIVGLVALPVHAAGALMLGFAAASLCMEVLSLPGIGLHAVGAGFSLILAGVYLTADTPGAHLGLVVPLSVLTAALTFLAGRRSWRYVRDRPLDESAILVGRGIVVLNSAGSTGHGVVSGQVWNLRTPNGELELEAGQSVRVTQATDGWLVVEPVARLDFW